VRLLGLVNPHAGGGAALRRFARFRARRDVRHYLEWVVTASAEEARERIRAAPTRGVEGVFLVGGDGTVHGALGALTEVGLPFGVVPAGRGNDFVRNIGVDQRDGDALLRSQRLQVRQLDLPTVNGTPFASIACLGFDALVNRFARDGAGYLGGTAGYVVCVLRALATYRPFAVEVTVDDWTWNGEITMVAVANGPYYGGGMRIAPAAVMDDGAFDVCVVGRVSRGRLLREFPKVFRGAHTERPGVIMRRGRVVGVATDEPREIFADGELAGSTPAVWSFDWRAMRVLLPEPEMVQ
jgi:YegS/Rv2252/BmrU family lipid kinase